MGVSSAIIVTLALAAQAYDPAFALRRVTLDTCGRSPTAEERAQVEAADDPQAAIAGVLQGCLASEYWLAKDGALWRLAHPKVRPLAAIKAGDDAGDIPLADYEDDYNLFVYTHSGDRDVRELLTAQYLVRRDDAAPPPERYRGEDISLGDDLFERGSGVAQLVRTNRRAGMLTTRWNLASNTMFTAIPRTTAAQAYRAYLGYDLAKFEGIAPVDGEPLDYDDKDVDAGECAVCHSTLDPLTYPFAHYNGIGGGSRGGTPFTYEQDRPVRFTASDGPLVVETPEAGVIFGTPVANLLEWAQVAVESEAFARTVASDFWRFFVGTEPEGPEFDEVWQRLRTVHAYRVEPMIRDIVMTRAFATAP